MDSDPLASGPFGSNIGSWEWQFPPRISGLRPSAIREILKWTSRPGIISFAGGLPAPELFPAAKIQQCCDEVLAEAAGQALQYSLTRGVPRLREQLVRLEQGYGVQATADDMIVTAGSQQGLDMVVQGLTSPGDVILTESPTYIGAIQIFQLHGISIVPAPTDADGIIPESLPELIARHRPKMIYVIPDFQNPTGITLSANRREQLLEIAASHRIPVVDDAPYTEIRFSGSSLPSLVSLNPAGTIGLRTFSKTIAPGFRVAWLTAPPPVLAKFEILKQALDLHASTFSQFVVARFLEQGWYHSHLSTIRRDYLEKRAIMIEQMKAAMPPGVSWTTPDGGLFLWVTLPAACDATAMLQEAVRHQVAYVPGEPFFAGPVNGPGGLQSPPKNVARLNFSNTTHAGIKTGINRLADLIRTASGEQAG